jgi:DNA-binding MarR family transcriptional regulator
VSTDERPQGISQSGQTLALFFAAHRVVDAALETEVRDRLGIGIGQFDVLSTIEQTPSKQLRMADIAERMCISRSGVTQSVDRLESLGLVVRVSHPQDRRTVLAEITPAGRALVPQGREAIEAVAARYLGGQLSSDESSVLVAALAKIAASSAQQGAHAADPSLSAPEDEVGAGPDGTGFRTITPEAVAATE